MPVEKCSNGLWRVGSGECRYSTKEKAMEVWKAILASGKYEKAINKQQVNVRKTKEGKGSQEVEQTQS